MSKLGNSNAKKLASNEILMQNSPMHYWFVGICFREISLGASTFTWRISLNNSSHFLLWWLVAAN